jgi:hypothetical protein
MTGSPTPGIVAPHTRTPGDPVPTKYLRLVPLALTVLAVGLPSQEKLISRWEAKQAEPWFQAGRWIHDFDAAKARAAKEGKVIFAYFTRSYSP